MTDPKTTIALEEKRFDDAVEHYIGLAQYVSFVELQRLLKPHMSVEGDAALSAPDCATCLIWAGMSAEFAQVILCLIQAKRIYPHTASPMLYMIDGGMLSLPIAKSRRAMQSKKEHWLPVSFCTFPPETARRRRKDIHA